MKKFLTLAALVALLLPTAVFAQLQPACTLVKDLTPGAGSTEFQDIERIKGQRSHEHFPYVTIGGTYFFSANANAAPGGQLYSTDGTAIGTKLLTSNTTFGPFKNLLRFRESIAFFAVDENAPGYREDLFFYDRSTGATTDLEVIGNCPVEPAAGYDRFNPFSMGDKVWYRKLKCGANAGADIWYDEIYGDTKVTNTTSYPHLLGTFGGKMFIVTGGTASHPGGTQLWKADLYDGQSATLVKAINFNNPRMDILPAINPGGTIGFLFIAENSANNGQSLWRTDGTAAGTYEVGKAFGYHNFISLGESAVYVGKANSGQATLMQTVFNPTTGVVSTKKLTDLALPDHIEDFELELQGNNVKGKMVFSNKKTPGDNELFRYDIKNGQYGLLANIHDPFQSQGVDGSSNPAEFTRIGPKNYTYFSADDGFSGREIWRTDGTPEGTKMIQDINPGPGHSNPEGLVRLNGKTLLFTADDGSHGRELWKLDLTMDIVRDGVGDLNDVEIALAGSEQFLEVVPNPVHDVVQIYSSSDKIANMSLFDITGKFIREIQVEGDATYANVADLRPGFYILKAKMINGEMMSKKVLKN